MTTNQANEIWAWQLLEMTSVDWQIQWLMWAENVASRWPPCSLRGLRMSFTVQQLECWYYLTSDALRDVVACSPQGFSFKLFHICHSHWRSVEFSLQCFYSRCSTRGLHYCRDRPLFQMFSKRFYRTDWFTQVYEARRARVAFGQHDTAALVPVLACVCHSETSEFQI